MRNGTGLATDDQTDVGKGTYNDVMMIDIHPRKEMMLSMINDYHPRDIHTGERRMRKLKWHRKIRQGGATIIVGNMDAHNRRWDPR